MTTVRSYIEELRTDLGHEKDALYAAHTAAEESVWHSEAVYNEERVATHSLLVETIEEELERVSPFRNLPYDRDFFNVERACEFGGCRNFDEFYGCVLDGDCDFYERNYSIESYRSRLILLDRHLSAGTLGADPEVGWLPSRKCKDPELVVAATELSRELENELFRIDTRHDGRLIEPCCDCNDTGMLGDGYCHCTYDGFKVDGESEFDPFAEE